MLFLQQRPSKRPPGFTHIQQPYPVTSGSLYRPQGLAHFNIHPNSSVRCVTPRMHSCTAWHRGMRPGDDVSWHKLVEKRACPNNPEHRIITKNMKSRLRSTFPRGKRFPDGSSRLLYISRKHYAQIQHHPSDESDHSAPTKRQNNTKLSYVATCVNNTVICPLRVGQSCEWLKALFTTPETCHSALL